MSSSRSASRRIVLLGGGYAGLTAAERLSHLLPRQGLSITLIDAKPQFQERIRLHQVAAGEAPSAHDHRSFLAQRGIAFIQARAAALDATARTVSLALPDGDMRTLAWDHLVLALGSDVDVNAIPGVREHAQALDSPVTAQRIHAGLVQAPRQRVLVVGGGLTGIETAAELAGSHPQATVSLAVHQPWQPERVPNGLSERAVAYLLQYFERHAIALHSGARVERLEPGVAHLDDGRKVPFDLCIWTSGFRACALAGQAGLQVDAMGRVRVDAALRSISHPHIVAIGDAAAAASPDSGPCRMSCATALAMATAGARTVKALLGGREPPPLRFNYLFRNISLGRDDGIIQFVDRRDVPRDLVWTGARAARWKEYVCSDTLSTIGLCPAPRIPAWPPARLLPQIVRGVAQYA